MRVGSDFIELQRMSRLFTRSVAISSIIIATVPELSSRSFSCDRPDGKAVTAMNAQQLRYRAYTIELDKDLPCQQLIFVRSALLTASKHFPANH